MENDLIFATEETLIQPVGGLIVEDPQEQDHVLGATGPDFDVLVEDGHWAPFTPSPELQRNKFGDTFMCVSYSNNNIHEFLLNRLFGEVVNMSDIFLGVGSGTVRNRGNSKRSVAEWKRLNGFVLESDYPFGENTTIDQAYAPLTSELLAKGLRGLDQYTFGYKWLADNSPATIKAGLKYSPVQVDVLGSYKVGKNGYIVWDADYPTYAHEVAIFDYEEGKCWWVFDSESMQFIKFDWNYPFGSPMIHALKRSMNIQIFKKKGQAGLAVKAFGEPSMIVFSGGSIIGEALFKSIYGITEFKQLPIKEVDEWPYPIRHILNCNPYYV